MFKIRIGTTSWPLAVLVLSRLVQTPTQRAASSRCISPEIADGSPILNGGHLSKFSRSVSSAVASLFRRNEKRRRKTKTRSVDRTLRSLLETIRRQLPRIVRTLIRTGDGNSTTRRFISCIYVTRRPCDTCAGCIPHLKIASSDRVDRENVREMSRKCRERGENVGDFPTAFPPLLTRTANLISLRCGVAINCDRSAVAANAPNCKGQTEQRMGQRNNRASPIESRDCLSVAVKKVVSRSLTTNKIERQRCEEQERTADETAAENRSCGCSCKCG